MDSYLRYKAEQMRHDIVKMVSMAGSGHPGGSLSSAEIISALYFKVLKHNPEDPKCIFADRFHLSKGHAAPALYSALARTGYFFAKELGTLRKLGSFLQGHPSSLKTPGVRVSSGSLGQGLSVGAGMALAAKHEDIGAYTFVLLGDGELEEGQVWEAARFASEIQLDNLVAIIDFNGLKLSGVVIDSLIDLENKWTSFGWATKVVDGHDMEEVYLALDSVREWHTKQPKVIIAKTVKGQGASFMQGDASWHGKAPNEEETEKALSEIDSRLKELEQYNSPEMYFDLPKKVELDPGEKGNVNELLEELSGMEKLATRKAFGKALVALYGKSKEVIVLDADLSKSTCTYEFSKVNPYCFYDVGIGEQNLVSVAAGLASCGKTVYAASFAMFSVGRAFDQNYNTVGYSKLNVRVIGSHGGIKVGEDGPSHQCLCDLALMRSIPGFLVLNPSDAIETVKMVEALENYEGPVYIRIGRNASKIVHDIDYDFEIGKADVVKEGSDVTIVSTGDILDEVVQATEILENAGLSVRVVNLHTLDWEHVDVEELRRAKNETKMIFTVEDHNIVGGLGDAVLDALSSEGAIVNKIGITEFAESGTKKELLEKYGLSAERIAEQILSFKDKLC